MHVAAGCQETGPYWSDGKTGAQLPVLRQPGHCPQLPHPARLQRPCREALEGFGVRKRNTGATNCDVLGEEEKFWGYDGGATITPLCLSPCPGQTLMLVTAREVPWDGGARFGCLAHGHRWR